MKPIYFISILCLLGFTSCNDFLDIKPTGAVTPTTAEEYNQLLISVYQAVPSERGRTTFRSDEYQLVPSTASTAPSGSTSPDDMTSYSDLWTWKDVNQQEGTLPFQYAPFYNVIYFANTTIENQTQIEGSPNAINQVVGEAYMLRAYMHFILANLYAPHYTKCDPVTTKAIPLKLNTELNDLLPKNTLEEVYSSILSDVKQAGKLLNIEKFETGKNYRFTTLSVDAFLSRIYLYMGNWKESLAASQRVITLKQKIENKEDVLENMNNSTILPNAYNSIESIVSLERNMTPSFTGAGRLNAAIRTLYTTSDQRRMKFYVVNSTSNFVVKKGGDIAYRSSFRMAEIYLNGAEAACRDNDLTTARNLVLKLMKQRFNTSGYTEKETSIQNMNQDDLLNEILVERFRELAFEGHRWFDLRRTTQPALEKTLTQNGITTTYRLEAGDPKYTIPFPKDAIEANPNLSN